LFDVECAKILPALQDDQNRELNETAASLKSNRHETEERHEQSDDPAHRSEQDIQENCPSDIERDREDADGYPQTEQ